MNTSTRILSVALLLAVAACDKAAVARSDSLNTALSEQQRLSSQLASQKDSLSRVVLDADAFIGQMDSAISSVRGMPKAKRKATDPLAAQLQARTDMQERVKALVTRAKATASQLAELQKKQAETDTANAQLKEQSVAQAAKIEEDAQLITDLGTTIERQRGEIASLGLRIDSLSTEMKTIGAKHYKAYYVVGTEKELIDKGVVTKEGGANLLIAHPGKTLVPSRLLNPDVFTPIDQRETHVIALPDTVSRYRIVSRQSLDAAEVGWRDATSFKGNLKISKPDEFWAPSRFLILVKM